MEGFLEEIAGFQNYNGQSGMYNREFFSKHSDINTLISLLQVANTYSSIISLLNKRHNKEDSAILEKLDQELKVLVEKISSIKSAQTDLCNKKLDNDSLRKAAYQSSEIDFDKIREMAVLDSRIDVILVENDLKIEVAINEEKNKNGERKKVDEKRAKLDTEIEGYIGRLNELFAGLNGKNIDIFNGLDINTLREQYEQGLVEIIQNTSMRKAYVSYLFDILKKESQMIPEIYATSQCFVSNAKKENGFDVPELVAKNDQIMLTESITMVAHDGLRQVADIWCRNATDKDEALTTIGNGYLSTQPFIDGMYDYISNLSSYSNDNSKGGADYDRLFSFNNQLFQKLAELQTKDSRSIRNIVGRITNSPHYYTSIEREPYEFATRIFDSFNHRHGDMRTQIFESKQSTMSDDQQTEQINLINQMKGMAIPQELTEEQKAILINNVLGAPVTTPSEEELSSVGMQR